MEDMPTTPIVPLGVIPTRACRASARSFPEPACVILASSSSRLVMNIPSLPPSIVWLFAVVTNAQGDDGTERSLEVEFDELLEQLDGHHFWLTYLLDATR